MLSDYIKIESQKLFGYVIIMLRTVFCVHVCVNNNCGNLSKCLCPFPDLFPLTHILTKHSAASSIKPNWKRCSSLKVSARAMRRLSEGSARSLLSWNCENIPYKRKQYKTLIQTPADITIIYIERFWALRKVPLIHRRCRLPLSSNGWEVVVDSV